MKRDNALLHGHGRLTPGKARELLRLARRHYPPAVTFVHAHAAEVEALTAVQRARRQWNRKGGD